MQILNVKTAKKYLQWVVCKKCSETAVGFVQQWKPVVFAVKILAVYSMWSYKQNKQGFPFLLIWQEKQIQTE